MIEELSAFSKPDSRNQHLYLYFDRILQQATNETKFLTLQNHIDTFLNGRNVCILNHGVTGEWIHFIVQVLLKCR